MLQRIWNQLHHAGLASSVSLSAVRDQEELLHCQLGKHLPVILEPERRDTFPSVALSAAFLHSVRGAGPDDVVCIMPADTYADDAFFHTIRQLEHTLAASGAELALVGVKPAFPSEEHGYLVPGENAMAKAADGMTTEDPAFVIIKTFVEKPDEAHARQLIERKALWNCGVFAFRLGLMLDWLQERKLPADYAELSQRFDELPNTSFDYAFAEKSQSMVALVYDGMWKDLGTWQSLTVEMDRFVIGQGAIADNAQNVHLINELDIPVYVIGLSDAIVAVSQEGILVADKRTSGKIKEWIGKMKKTF